MTEMIYCCACGKEVRAKLVNGSKVYPHRHDLKELPFWQCPHCQNFVGCHHKTINKTKPLGCIPTKEIKDARIKIHAILDPIWAGDKSARTDLYRKISVALGYKYHTADIRSIEQAREVYKVILGLKNDNTIRRTKKIQDNDFVIIPNQNLSEFIGKIVHVEGWNVKSQFRFVSVSGDKKNLVTPKSGVNYQTRNRLAMTRHCQAQMVQS